MTYPRMASFKTADDLQTYLTANQIDLRFDRQLEPAGALARPYTWSGGTIGNRFCVLPMEGWDGTSDGQPSELTERRWANFGRGGAKLIWGGEAAAVRHDGRANPNQLVMNAANAPRIGQLRELLVRTHAEQFGRADDLLVGLQLTHSGRFARPNDKKRMEPSILYPHPILNRKFGLADDHPLLSDADIDRLIADFVAAARLAQQAGFAFVDVKHCHGYLGHEFLSAVDRPGKFGGSWENRTRFLREIVAGIRATAPGLAIGVRVSVYDFVPFLPGATRVGEPSVRGPYRYAFGGDPLTGTDVNLVEPLAFMQTLSDLGIELVCTTAGSPYYTPHLQRPATFPPSDGYLPPEEPLVGVARQVNVTAQLKRAFPQLAFVGSGYSYLQEWLPHVGQHAVAAGAVDFVGLGRMILSYPDLPADVLAGKTLERKKICRTFSECTTAPRNGMVSGCYPLDPFYKERPERVQLGLLKSHAGK
jgi:2,4-dienoyl-CoA reductase-like NADH-dependent reductase (Old Yellow Enzyme family)